jgi:hypothetical protein
MDTNVNREWTRIDMNERQNFTTEAQRSRRKALG